jgi:serine/threonine protein kinase
MVGTTIGAYRVLDKLGEGGMGEVWSATDTRLHRSAAIKALPGSVANDAERLARFRREAQLLAALGHPAAVYGLEQSSLCPPPAAARRRRSASTPRRARTPFATPPFCPTAST